jgi:hypothetical protein
MGSPPKMRNTMWKYRTIPIDDKVNHSLPSLGGKRDDIGEAPRGPRAIKAKRGPDKSPVSPVYHAS